jgi:uncharacterized alpha-E superfamily protein
LPSLLARFAENSFWLARYMERAENLARILSVNLVYAADNEDVAAWLQVVQLFSDAERFFAVHDRATADAVLHWYVLDADNPSSILAEVAMARENARTLRHLISTEAWGQLNVFYNRLRAVRPPDLALRGWRRSAPRSRRTASCTPGSSRAPSTATKCGISTPSAS